MRASLILLLAAYSAASSEYAIVNVAVADLMATPAIRACCPPNWSHNQLQLTQLLFYDPVRVLSTDNGWSFVEAVDQPNLLGNGTWGGYQGFILSSQLTPAAKGYARGNSSVVVPHADIFKRSCLLKGCLPDDVVARVSFGTWLALVDVQFGWGMVLLPSGEIGYISMTNLALFPKQEEAVIRQCVLSRAPLLLGYIYSWGGRSALSLESFRSQFSGLDCSGFTSILYRSCGAIIPRDSSKQALWSHAVAREQLQEADVFYFGDAQNASTPVTHVMGLYSLDATQPLLFEAAPNASHILPIETVFAVPFSKLKYGQVLGKGSIEPGAVLTWGNFFPIRPWLYDTGPKFERE